MKNDKKCTFLTKELEIQKNNIQTAEGGHPKAHQKTFFFSEDFSAINLRQEYIAVDEPHD